MMHGLRHSGFTLVETIAVILVLGVLAGVTAPLMVGAAGSYADARDGRRAVEDASFALDRIVRILREAPSDATAGEPGFASADADGFELADGTEVSLSGTDLMLSIAGGAAAPLCRDVAVFELTYRGADGAVLDFGGGDVPGDAARVEIRIAASGQEMRTAVFLRATMEAES